VNARRSQTLTARSDLVLTAIVHYPNGQVDASKFAFEKTARLQGSGPNCAVTYFTSFLSGRVLGLEERAFGDSTVDEVHSRREKEVRDDIARRLKPVCSNFPDDEFQKLVKTMADQQVKCERRLIW